MLRRTVLFFLLLLFIFSGCSFPEEFGLPSWESTFRMSILNDNYDVTELAEEDSALVAIGDTLAFFKTDSESVEIELDSTEEVNEYKEVEIGEIEINAPQPKNTEITIQEMVEDYGLAVPGLNESMHGQPVIAPQFAVDEMIEKFDKFDEFQEVRFSSGYLDMKFTNNMIFWLGSADGELPFTAKLRGVYQDGSVEDLIELDFPEGIAPNGGIVEYNNYDISGMLIPDSLRVVISGWSDGTAGGHEILDYYAGLNIDMDFHDFIVEYAIAPIPAQAIDDTVEVKISEEYEIYRADVAEGNYILRLDIQNQIDLNIHANIYINKLFDTDGQPYETNFVIPRSEGGSTDYQKNINLSGFSIGDDSEPVEKVIIDFFTFTEDTEEEVRIIDSNDKLMIDAVLGPLDFAYIKAIIAEQQDIEPINGDFDIDLDVETQGLFEIVGESQMKLDLSYGNSKIPAQLILNLTAINENGESVDLIDLDTNTSPIIEIPSVSHYTIIKDFSDYNLNEILSIIPTDINYEVIPLIGGAGSEEAEVYVGDRLNADIEFTSKIELNTDSWLIPKEEGEPKVNEEDVSDFDEQIYDTFKNGIIKLKYLNTTGIEVAADILICRSETELKQQIYEFDNPDTTKVKVISVPYLQTTNEKELQEIQVQIQQTDLEYLLEEITYIGTRLGLYSEPGTPLTGSIQMQAELIIEVQMGDHLLED